MDVDYLVVGGSAAGTAAVTAIETAHPGARTLLVERGPDLPHDKPALSKQLLRREAPDDSALLRSREEWAASPTEVLLGTAAVRVHDDGAVELSDGRVVHAGAVVLAPGCTPRSLPLLTDAPNAVPLRALADLRRLRDLVDDTADVVLVGGGFIGLEVAASLVGRVGSVTVVEQEQLPLQRALGATAATFLLGRHLDAGVQVRAATSVTAVDRDEDGAVRALHLADGTRLPADLVVVGVGVVPDLAWLTDGPVRTDDGILVDEHLETSVPGVFAAGDAVRFHDRRTDRSVRVEHWTTAGEQGRLAGRNAVARVRGAEPTVFDAVPYVWSDQYENKVQVAGYTRWATESRVLVDTGTKLVVEYLEGGRRCAVLGVNAPRDVMLARRELATVSAGPVG